MAKIHDFVSGNPAVANNIRNISYWVLLEALGFRATLELVCVVCWLPGVSVPKPLIRKALLNNKSMADICGASALFSRIIVVNNNSGSCCTQSVLHVLQSETAPRPVISGRCGIRVFWRSCSFEVNLIHCGQSISHSEPRLGDILPLKLMIQSARAAVQISTFILRLGPWCMLGRSIPSPKWMMWWYQKT